MLKNKCYRQSIYTNNLAILLITKLSINYHSKKHSNTEFAYFTNGDVHNYLTINFILLYNLFSIDMFKYTPLTLVTIHLLPTTTIQQEALFLHYI